ncbi:MAG: DUF4167 domain-containing protein, partial [Rhodospirillaceae bacterium]|nr:DUF4167 domain-containing protein [Rhodospirillaceae bacterium]
MNKNQHQSKNRSRGRGSARRGPNRGNSFESNGPEVKVRGSAQQVLDKYLQLARDAQSSGDRVNAENYLQYAEHYYRIINADSQEQANRSQNAGRTPAQEGSGENAAEQAKSGSGASDGRPSSKQRSRGSNRGGPKGRQQQDAKS